MRTISALLHTQDHANQLGRCLESLHPCDRIFIADHGSRDTTVRIAREYGARVFSFSQKVSSSQLLSSFGADWILCLQPCESLTETLSASLYEWKAGNASAPAGAFNILLRAETESGWMDLPTPRTRLVRGSWPHWDGQLPAYDSAAEILEGRLLRFK
jgi:hypothetical protein